MKKWSFFLALLLALLLVLQPAAFAAESGWFDDVAEDAWYKDAVAVAYERGWMNGTSASSFGPDETLTRAQLITILWRIAGEPISDAPLPFSDVENGLWYTEAVRWAAAEGLTARESDCFEPDAKPTREEAALILWHYAKAAGVDVSVGEDTNILSYNDVFDISEAAVPALQWAVGAEILNGTGNGNLSPLGLLTRAQTAAILTRYEAAGAAEDSQPDEAVPSPAWVTELPAAQDPEVTQLFIVAGMGMDKTTATISLHQRDENGQWTELLTTPGFVGRNGLCPDEDHAEGCGQTPIGTYSFNKAFGIAEDPGCAIPYFQVTEDTYWSGDMREGMRYNEMVDIRDYPDLDMENSEHIVHYIHEYQYCLNISFNEDGTPGRGSAIFLHCFGARKPYTGGCVAIPEYCMKQVMQTVQPDCVVIVDTLDNLGGSL